MTDVTSDGFVFCVHSGEILGFDPDRVMPGNEAPERFAVRSPEAADWVLSLRLDLESEVVGLEAKKRAILGNIDAQIAYRQARLNYLSFRFDAELEAQARRELEGSRKKTVTYPHGSVSFRVSQGSTVITDAGKAVRFALEWAPEKVKHEVGSTGLHAAIKAYREANDEDPETGDFCQISGPSEKVLIKTGIAPGKDSTR